MNERSTFLRAAVFLAIVAVAPARADILVGDFTDGNALGAHSILRFRDSANANAVPVGSFTTDLPGVRMQTPFYLTYEPIEHVVYVGDFYGQAIHVYPEDARGNTAPLRTFTSPSLGQPRRVAVSVPHDELFAAVSGCCVAAYPRMATGNTGALRFIQWGGSNGSVTRLNNPTGPVLRPASDTLIVADYQQNPDNSYSAVLLSFDRNANGNAAPVAALEGNLTMLGSSAVGPAYDEAHDELFVVGVDAASTYRLLSFAGTASGNVAPLRAVEGPAANLAAVTDVAYDPIHDTIYVIEGGYNGFAPNVLAFPRTATGNVAPTRTIAGAATTIGYPIGIAVTYGHIFEDGFE